MDRHEYQLSVFRELMTANLNAAREFLNLKENESIGDNQSYLGLYREQTDTLVEAIKETAATVMLMPQPTPEPAPKRGRGRPTKTSVAVVEIKEIVAPEPEAEEEVEETPTEEDFVEDDINVEIDMSEEETDGDFVVDVKAGKMPTVTKEWVLANEEHMTDQCRELASKYFTKYGIDKTKEVIVNLTGFEAISKFPTPDLLYVYYTGMCPLVRG